MTVFRVWAPLPTVVSLELDGRSLPMARTTGGWWDLDVPGAGAGTDYWFRLDGDNLVPDPRSSRQPAGIDGPSRVVEHDAFAWTDAAWRGLDLRTSVLYELHVGTFTPAGTFDAVIERLDHLLDLGVTAIELLPVATFPGDRNWGYDGVLLFAPQETYGGPDGLKRLIDACHRRGLGVVLDVVYNHFGPYGNHLPRFGPYLTDAHRTPWGDAVNFDQPGSDEVRRYVIDNALMWLRDYHVDALRLDAVHAIVDTSAHHLVQELAEEVHRLGQDLDRHLVVIAESDDNDPRLVEGVTRGGYGVDAQWSDDFHHALHVALTGERSGYYVDFDGMDDLATAWRHAWVVAGRYSIHRERRHGWAHRDDLPGERFVVYAQDHDQVGNRAAGDRLAALVDVDRLKIAAALTLLSPFVPMLFMGEEWGASTPFQYFTSHPDPALARAVAEGRRAEFPVSGDAAVPDPQDPATFTRSVLRWSEVADGVHAELLDWHRRCIALRRAHHDLGPASAAEVRVVADRHARTLVAFRRSVTVAVNLGDADAVVVLGDWPKEVLLGSHPGIAVDDNLLLPPASIAVLGSPPAAS